MWLTSTSIRRPVFILMVVAALIVMGLNSCGKMKLESNPKVDIPYVTVFTAYPGAGPSEVETQITKKLEDAVAAVNGVKTITSSSQESQSAISIEFNLGVDPDVAAADVREKISGARASLPTDAKDPVVTKFDLNSLPILYYGMSGKRPSRDLRDLADNVIKQRIGKVPGVAAVSVTGGDVREINVGVHKDRLDAYGIGIPQIVALVQANNLNFPVGHIIESDREYSVRIVGEYPQVQTIRDMRLHMPNGQTVRLGDIADVQDTVEERRDVSRIDREDSVSLVIQKTSEGNTVEVADGVKREMAALQKELPKDVHFVISRDDSTHVADSVTDVKTSLLLGAFLAVVVVFLFLHNVRGTAIVALVIPTSIFATFLPMYAFGFTLNNMTLLALSISVGVLVDDAIVVLENIYRHLSMGEQPREAAINGRSEIGLAAITITLVDVVVYLPIAFMAGIAGQFFRSFGITIACAVLFSLFMSFTLTPMLASRWYRPGEAVEAEHGIFGVINRFYKFLERTYRRILVWALEYRGVVVYVGSGLLILVFYTIVTSDIGASAGKAIPYLVGLFLAGGVLLLRHYRFVGIMVTAAGVAGVFLFFGLGLAAGRPLLLFRFAPEQDQGQISIIGEMPAGTSLEKTTAVAKRIEDIVHQVPEVKSIFTEVGATSAGALGLASIGTQYFTMSLNLRDKVSLADSVNPFANTAHLRKRADTLVAEDIRNRIGKVPGATIKVAAVSGFQGGSAPLQVDLHGQNLAELSVLGDQVLRIFKEEPGVLNADISTRLGRPEQRIDIDRDKAASYGLSIAQVAAALRDSLEGDDTEKFRENGNEYPIRVQLADKDRHDTNVIPDLIVATAPGSNGIMQPIRLSDVAHVVPSTGPTKIDRMNREKLVSITANLMPGYSPGNMQLNMDKKLEALNWGANTYSWGGENKMQNEEGAYMGAALGLAVVLVFMLMAALFDNVLYPLVIMFSLPQALIGALLGLIAFGHSLTIVSMIGIISLMGLVTKNAILLVDYTGTLRQRGLSRTEAILQAGPTRLRPILMTTIAMILATLPTALGLGRGAEFRAPMGSPVIGGLSLSMLLTLVVIPCVYTYFDDLNRAFGRIFHRKRLEDRAVEIPTLPDHTAVD